MLSITSTKKNILANILLQITTAISGFVLPPLLIVHYDSSMNGMISSIKQFIAYLSLVEAGVGISSIAALYEPIAAGNIKRRNSVLSATRNFYNISGILFLILLIICSIAYSFVVRSEYKLYIPFLLFLIIGTSGLADFFFIGKYRVLLFATKRNYVISIVQTIGILLNTTISVFLIKRECNIILVQVFSYGIYILRFIIIKIYVRVFFSDLSFNEEPEKIALKQRWDALYLQLSSLIVFNSPIIILTLMCSLRDVSVYAIFAMIFTAVDNLVSIMSNGLSANFGELYYRDKKELQKYFRKYETLFFLFVGWCYSCAFLLSKDFISIYTLSFTDANYKHFEYIPLFVFIGVMNKIRVPGGMLIEAAGKFKETRNRGILEAIINLCGSIIFTYFYGPIGVLLGGCLSYCYRTVDVIIYSNKKILGASFIITIGKILLIIMIYIVICVSLMFIKNTIIQLNINSYKIWFMEACSVGIVLSFPIILYFTKKKICKN